MFRIDESFILRTEAAHFSGKLVLRYQTKQSHIKKQNVLGRMNFYFLLILHGLRNSVVVCVFDAMVTFLLTNGTATIGGYTCRHTD